MKLQVSLLEILNYRKIHNSNFLRMKNRPGFIFRIGNPPLLFLFFTNGLPEGGRKVKFRERTAAHEAAGFFPT
ncbi:hypothetical protein [uncultured Akkermansia sp.]|uniref:hypothetical protein n=1 Tax=uncultured Akkermansia sp. TaxID=512294 RepID=UPI0026144DC8|nr:hypothetical protein [uncultured Akkermansia sp.]